METELIDITKKTGLIFLGRIFDMALGLVLNLIIARFFGASVYGTFIYVLTIINFGTLISILGMGQGLLFMIPRFQRAEELAERNALISFAVFAGVLIAGVVATLLFIGHTFLASRILNDPALAPVILKLAPLIILQVFLSLSESICRCIGEIKRFILGRYFFGSVLQLVAVISLAMLGWRLDAIIGAYYFTYIALGVYYLDLFRRRGVLAPLQTRGAKLWQETRIYALPLYGTVFLNFLQGNCDKLILGYFVAKHFVGIYNIAILVGAIGVYILEAVNLVFAPQISQLYHSQKMDKVKTLYRAITKGIMVVNLCVFPVMVVFTRDIMSIFGRDYSQGAMSLIFIAIGQFVNAATGPANIVYTMSGKPKYAFGLAFLNLGISLTASLLLIPVYGINGAAIALMISLSVINLLRVFIIYRLYGMHPFGSGYFRIIGFAALCIAGVYGLQTMVHPLPELVRVGIFGCLYLFAFIACGIRYGLSVSEKDLLKTLWNRPKAADNSNGLI